MIISQVDVLFARLTFGDCCHFYGPDYLSEAVENSDKGGVLGKAAFFVRTQNDHLRILDGREFVFTSELNESTLSGWVKDLPKIPNLNKPSEITKIKKEGIKFWAVSKYNFISGKSKLDDRHVSQLWYKSQENYNPTVIHYNVSVDDGKRIACGLIDSPSGIIVPYTEFKVEDTPPEEEKSSEDWVSRESKMGAKTP